MSEYNKLYYMLFNQISNTIEILTNEIEKLKKIQIITEDLFINNDNKTYDDD